MPDRDDEHQARNSLLAFEDAAYLRRDELRPFRLALEFNKIDLALKDQGIASTIVVFGSSRILSPEDAELAVKSAMDGAARQRAMQQRRLAAWYEEARSFARIVSERGGALVPEGGIRRNVIVTGGGPGIMEAANRGAADAGAPSIGFNIVLPSAQTANPYSSPDLTFRFHYFAMRKMHFAMRASALVVFPGGFGTMDELFEILTLKQTRRTAKMPVVLFSREYWRSVINLEELLDLGMIEHADAHLFEIVDTAEEAWKALVRSGLPEHTPLCEP